MTPSAAARGIGRGLAAALLAIAAVASPARLWAQDSPAAFESMEVVLINVEVWAQDRDGKPIRGLTAESFEVLEDGVPVPITHFAEVREPSGSR
jgi:hypothetical protein